MRRLSVQNKYGLNHELRYYRNLKVALQWGVTPRRTLQTPCFFALLCRVPTCLSLPEGLLQPVRPHKLTGLAHRQLFAAHPSRDEILFQI